MFVDTSAIVAIVAEEDDAEYLASRIGMADHGFTSPLVLLEATMVLSTRLGVPPLRAMHYVLEAVSSAGLSIAPIELHHLEPAVQAFANYGKGRGHPAQLNLADCLSYACAKAGGVPLLYKGDDFSRTDVASAG